MSSLRRRQLFSSFMTAVTGLCAVLAVSALFVILGYILLDGARQLNFGFLIHEPKPVGEAGSGIANAIVGSLMMVGLGTLIGLPVGVLAGLYLSEFGNHRLGDALRFLSDTLIGTPTILIGVFVWTVMVKRMGHFSALAGGVALGIIMMPIVARTTEEMVRLVPQSLREAALALGAPTWRVSLGVVLRSASGGVASGAMLAIARIAGETAPLLFTALGLNYLSTSLCQPMASLTQQIYYYASSPYDEWHAMAWAATLVLVALILATNVIVKFLTRNRYQ